MVLLGSRWTALLCIAGILIVSSARATAQYDEEDEYADLDESDPYGYDEDDYSIEDKDDEEHVVTLTADNFESNVLKKPHALVGGSDLMRLHTITRPYVDPATPSTSSIGSEPTNCRGGWK